MSRRIANPGLRRICRERGITLDSLSRVCRTSRKSIWQWSRGRRLPGVEAAIAAFLGITAAALHAAVIDEE